MTKPSLAELDVFFEQRMGAHHQVDVARGQTALQVRLLTRLARADEQIDVVRQGLEQVLDVEVMLHGQDFRGRHERHLVTILHGQDRRLNGHDGLAGTYVTLQQPVHRPGRAHVLHNLLQHAFLRRGRMKRQDALDRLADTVGDGELDSRRALRLATLEGEPGAHHKELFKDHPDLSRTSKTGHFLEGNLARRKVGLPQGRRPLHQLVLLPHRRRQPVADGTLQESQGAPDQTAQDARPEPAHRFVDGHDAPHRQRVDILRLAFGQNLKLRLNDLQVAGAEGIALDLAVEENALTLAKDLLLFQVQG